MRTLWCVIGLVILVVLVSVSPLSARGTARADGDCGGLATAFQAAAGDTPARERLIDRMQAENCDADGDGVIDVLDQCPGFDDTANNDGDALPDDCDPDDDNDGVLDVNDAFPTDPNESADTDGDGVGNNADKCPGSASGAEIHDDGCVYFTIKNAVVIEGTPCPISATVVSVAGNQTQSIAASSSAVYMIPGGTITVSATTDGVTCPVETASGDFNVLTDLTLTIIH